MVGLPLRRPSWIHLTQHRKIGQNVTEEEYKEYLDTISLFDKWFNKNVASTAPDSDDHAIVVLPIKGENSA